MPKSYRAVLVGCGRMGATIDDEVRDRPDSFLWLPYSHAAGHVACERTELVAVSDVIPEKVEAIQKRYSVPRGYTDYREMIEKEQPDIVSIATRPAPHKEQVVFAAEHGVKGIYCEKPLCCSMEEADAMVESCDRNGAKFNYGTQRRYMAQYQKMRELIQAGELGDVHAVICHCGVGAALWGHTHTTDMLMFLAGDAEVEFVQGTIACKDSDWDGNRLNTDPGITSGYVKFKNGVHGYLVAGSGYEFEVSSTKGKLRTLNNGSNCQWRRVGEWNILEDVPFPTVQRSSGTVKCIEDLVEAIETGRDTQGNIHLACRSQEIIMGIIESHRQGGARVPLPLQNRNLYVGRDNW